MIVLNTPGSGTDPLTILASQAQAEAGTENDVLMTPLRTKEAILASEINKPFIVAFKNVTVLTTGAPADVATVTLPSWLTRYVVMPSTTAVRCIAESASGTLAAAGFTTHQAAGGSGTSLTATNITGPASTAAATNASGTGVSVPFATSNTIYLRQTTNSANAGTVSVYLTLVPLL